MLQILQGMLATMFFSHIVTTSTIFWETVSEQTQKRHRWQGKCCCNGVLRQASMQLLLNYIVLDDTTFAPHDVARVQGCPDFFTTLVESQYSPTRIYKLFAIKYLERPTWSVSGNAIWNNCLLLSKFWHADVKLNVFIGCCRTHILNWTRNLLSTQLIVNKLLVKWRTSKNLAVAASAGPANSYASPR